jgi:hypothetical protein
LSPGPLAVTKMPGPVIIIAAGTIGLTLITRTPTFASDVAGVSCSDIGSFARLVAEQKSEGVPLKQAVRHLRRSFGREHPETEHELEKIIQAIYEMPIFSTATPAEVGTAYQTACETG